ncbi:MAG: hypothetical protein J6E32_09590 [Lachnospiraceae bacterium]|nr:hypothetical protein [Lachnospiraceae bacterium]
MSRENNHKDHTRNQAGINNNDQAQRLLREITDIDDRFLIEAMEDSGNGASVSGRTTTESTISEQNLENDLNTTDGITKDTDKQRRKLRRYSAWALTAAACLTVIIVGRFVSVNRVRTETSQIAVMSEQADDAAALTGAASDESVKDYSAEDGEEKALIDAAAPTGAASDESVKDYSAENGEEKALLDAEAADSAAGESIAAAASNEQAPATANLRTENEQAAGVIDPGYEDDSVAAGAGAAVSMANPFTEYKTITGVQKAAGFDISLPDAFEPYENLIYRAIQTQLIEVIYLDDNKEEGYRIRKGRNMEDDISGDYNEYPVEDVLTLGPAEDAGASDTAEDAVTSDTAKDAGKLGSQEDTLITDRQKDTRIPDDIMIRVRGDKADQWKCVTWTQKDGSDVYSYAIDADQRTFTSDEILEMACTLSGRN